MQGKQGREKISQAPGGGGETQGHELSPHLSSVIKTAVVRSTAPTPLYQRELVGRRGSWEDWRSGRRMETSFFFFIIVTSSFHS